MEARVVPGGQVEAFWNLLVVSKLAITLLEEHGSRSAEAVCGIKPMANFR